jgi:hypothetical protein
LECKLERDQAIFQSNLILDSHKHYQYSNYFLWLSIKHLKFLWLVVETQVSLGLRVTTNLIELSEEMYKEGYYHITNMDIS